MQNIFDEVTHLCLWTSVLDNMSTHQSVPSHNCSQRSMSTFRMDEYLSGFDLYDELAYFCTEVVFSFISFFLDNS